MQITFSGIRLLVFNALVAGRSTNSFRFSDAPSNRFGDGCLVEEVRNEVKDYRVAVASVVVIVVVFVLHVYA